MSKYLEVAAQANGVAKEVVALVAEQDKPKVAELLAKLVNLGIRCSPRGVQHTVRLNAVRVAMTDLPVRVSMEERVDLRTQRSYNALLTQQIIPTSSTKHELTTATAEEPTDE